MAEILAYRIASFAWTSNGALPLCATIPLELRPLKPPEQIIGAEAVPNEETAKVIRDARAGKNVVRCESVEDMFRKLGS